jgi:hypothetical protein
MCAYQLVCDGLSFAGLISDNNVLKSALSTVRFKGAHYVFDVGQRLPRVLISLFAKSNGVVIKVGDASHPHAVEVVTCYPDWAERNERVLDEIRGLLRDGVYEKDYLKKPEYVT